MSGDFLYTFSYFSIYQIINLIVIQQKQTVQINPTKKDGGVIWDSLYS